MVASRTDGNLFSRLGGLVAAHPWRVLAASLLITVLAATVALRFRLDSSLVGLFPDTPAARDYREFLETFGGAERVLVMLEARGEPEQLAEAAEAVAERLRGCEEVAEAHAGLGEEGERFLVEQLLPAAPWLLAESDLPALAAKLTPEAVARRAVEVRDVLRHPAGLLTEELVRADPLALASPLSAGRAGAPATVDPLTGAFLSRDGAAALVVVTPRRAELDPAGGRALVAAIERAVAAASTESGLVLTFHAVGGPLYAAHDEKMMREDLSATAGGAVGAVSLLLVAGFEGVVLPAIGIAALLTGLLWTGGAVVLLLGPITGIGLGFAAMLIGLGDDMVVHSLSRFRQELADGVDPAAALKATFARLGAPLVGAAMTTVVGFAALGLAHQRSLRELGIATAIGVTLTLVSAALVGGPLARLAGPWLARRSPGVVWRSTDRLVVAVTGWAARRRTWVLALVAVATLASLAGMTKLRLETDLRALRPADNPLERAERAIQERFAIDLETITVVVKGQSIAEALDRTAVVRDLLARSLGAGVEVFSPSDLVLGPQRAARRTAELRSLGLERAMADFDRSASDVGLNPAAFATAGFSLAERERLASRIPKELWLFRERVRESSSGAAVAVEVRLPAGSRNQVLPAALVAAVKRAAPGTIVASVPLAGLELREVATRDFAILGSVAALLIVAVVAVQFRGELLSLGLGFVPVLLALLWTFGLWGWLGRPLDLVSLVVIPVVLGIGIDDGLHVVHAASHEGIGVVGAAREAGRGILLANLTTIAGFASLTASRMPGLRSAGALIGLGIAISVLGSLVVLPACGRRVERGSTPG